jgi:hypothetical protein
MSDYGMKFVQEGKSLADAFNRDITYQTSSDTLQVDITQDPSHIDVIDPLKSLSVFSPVVANSSDHKYQEEILFQIEHLIPFKPDFTCYFYLVDSPFPADIGNYRLDYYRIGQGGEYIRAFTDEKYFNIVHSASVTGGPGVGVTYPYTWTIDNGSKMKFRVKYMIHPVPDLGLLDYAS